ncbi:MAG: hypothetical protein ACOH2K_04565 [Burkholderiaceae bacterium]
MRGDEKMCKSHHTHRITQKIDMAYQQIVAGSMQQIDLKEVKAIRMPGASRVGIIGFGIPNMRRNALRLLTPYEVRLTASRP